MASYIVRPISRAELEIPLAWARQEGWNPGKSDADAFYAIDPRGFYMGFLDGEPIASLSAVSYDEDFGFLGLYIVKKEFRGKGYGYELWKQTLKHLPTQNIGLDGVVEEQQTYKKSGFAFAYRTIRYEGRGLKEKLADPLIVALSDVPKLSLFAYDQSIFLHSRKSFLTNWISIPKSLAIGYWDGSRLSGYGVIRMCQVGYKIGPLFADTDLVANLLFRKMLTFAGPDSPVYIDVPEVNEKAIALAESHGQKPIFETARMYTKTFPPTPLFKVFGNTTLEVG